MTNMPRTARDPARNSWKGLWRIDMLMLAVIAFVMFAVPLFRHVEVVGRAHSAAPVAENKPSQPVTAAHCSPRNADCDPTDNAATDDTIATPIGTAP